MLASGGPETIAAPILSGMYGDRSLLSDVGSAVTIRGSTSKSPTNALMAPAVWRMIVASRSASNP